MQVRSSLFPRLDVLAGLGLITLTCGATAQVQPVTVRIDMTDAPRHVIHVAETLPAHAGVNSYSFPQWIPGEHLPGGPIDNLTGVVFHAGDAVIPWRRDLVDMYQFHVTAPAGTRMLKVDFDMLEVPSRADTTGVDHMNWHVAMLETSDVVMYPSNTPSTSIAIAATVHLPEGWSSATAMRSAGQDGPMLHGQDTTYETVTLDQFVDSPILSGDHCRQYPLAPEIQPVHTLDVCAEKASDLELQPAVLADMNGLVRQTTKLFVGHHYRHYDFLVGVSEHLDGDSLEHGQSADYIVKSLDLTDPNNAEFVGFLLPHEYVHSWCGKYRRPADLATPEFHTPMRDDLLWVYEGLTQYYGIVAAVRAGFATPEAGVEEFVHQINVVDKPGRTWRPLQDTADASSILRGVSNKGSSWRLQQDYYYEGALDWLAADMKIRELSGGKKSLDDFASHFLGSQPGGRIGDTPPGVLPYAFEDVVRGLNAIVPYDWAGFWTARLTKLTALPPVDGFAAAGYDYGYKPEMLKAEADQIAKYHVAEMYNSLGTLFRQDGKLAEMYLTGPAFKAGLSADDKVVEVNGKPYSVDAINAAVARAATDPAPIVLKVQRGDGTATVRIDYHGGLKYSSFSRNEKPDVLTTGILKAR